MIFDISFKSFENGLKAFKIEFMTLGGGLHGTRFWVKALSEA